MTAAAAPTMALHQTAAIAILTPGPVTVLVPVPRVVARAVIVRVSVVVTPNAAWFALTTNIPVRVKAFAIRPLGPQILLDTR
jgi:hypothetical protein